MALARIRVLLPLFLVSMATIGFEIALTRYFAVAKWSEYGYWVISIVLAGFALSGVVMALARDRFAAHGAALLAWLPALLILAAAIGFHFVTTNPFNPLQLQNPATVEPQLWNIAWYYLALLPFFFLAGTYVSLFFVLHAGEIGRVYGYDLTGAGCGALAVLGLMYVVHPFHLVPCLLVPLALAAFRRRLPLAAALLATAAGAGLLLLDDRAGFNEYKAIYAPLNVPGARVVAERLSPRGLTMLLDDFTERVDTDISNNAGQMNLPGPPVGYGLYRDGNRIAALPKPGPVDSGYAPATLAALPYLMRPHSNALLIGASGGFRVAEVEHFSPQNLTVLEPEPTLFAAIRHGFGPAAPQHFGPSVRFEPDSPIAVAAASPGRYDIIDISGDFLDSAAANSSAFAAEAITTYLKALRPGGILSIPASIREFPSYAIRVLATSRAGLLAAGIRDPARHVLVYRSAWNVRVLVSNTPFGAARVAAAKAFCDERSFDISYFPGMDVAASRAGIYNDLPAVSFEKGQVTSGDGLHDAIADEALAVLQGRASESSRAFNLSPITYDRPSFYAVLRLSHLGTILQRLEILPQAEIGPLVNLAVLAQAIVIAAIVLLVPLAGGRRVRAPGGGTLRGVVFFAALGLGFLFIEIFAIERASFYLDDRTSGFALVLTGMLIFSGLGSLLADRMAHPARAARGAVAAILLWGVLLLALLQPAMLATLDWPWALRAVLVVATVAPASLALGLPFPLGLARSGQGGFLPWAWGINGAFSVVSTPLANLVSLTFGYDRVLLAALVLYLVSALAFPPAARSVGETAS